jgi:hypothetical protein
LRNGIELGDGKPTLATGDVATVPAAAHDLVRAGAADYAAADQ